jgi:hypothetical protein
MPMSLARALFERLAIRTWQVYNAHGLMSRKKALIGSGGSIRPENDWRYLVQVKCTFYRAKSCDHLFMRYLSETTEG